MANTTNSNLHKHWAEKIVREMEREKEILETMTPEQRIGYWAAKASFGV